jgi:hypothetical protein
VLLARRSAQREGGLLLCAAAATAIYAIYQSLFPADSAWKICGLVLLTAAIFAPLHWRKTKERRLT